MRIVHVITRLIVGGAQENTLLSCEGQHARGHEVTLVTGPAIGPEGSLMGRAKAAGYRVVEVDEMRRSILPVKDFRTYHRLVRNRWRWERSGIAIILRCVRRPNRWPRAAIPP